MKVNRVLLVLTICAFEGSLLWKQALSDVSVTTVGVRIGKQIQLQCIAGESVYCLWKVHGNKSLGVGANSGREWITMAKEKEKSNHMDKDCSIVITVVTAKDLGIWVCSGNNRQKEIEIGKFQLFDQDASRPKLTIVTQPKDKIWIAANTSLILECGFSLNINCNWKQNGIYIKSRFKYLDGKGGVQTSNCSIVIDPPLTSEYSGQWQCMAPSTDIVDGMTSHGAQVSVMPTSATRDIVEFKNISIADTDEVELHCNFTDAVECLWKHNDVLMNMNDHLNRLSFLESSGGHNFMCSIKISSLNKGDTGAWQCGGKFDPDRDPVMSPLIILEVTSPCDDVTCGQGKTCLLDEHKTPICRCENRPNCSEELIQVCGSDSKSYKSECDLYEENCDKQDKSNMVHPTPCAVTEEWIVPVSVAISVIVAAAVIIGCILYCKKREKVVPEVPLVNIPNNEVQLRDQANPKLLPRRNESYYIENPPRPPKNVDTQPIVSETKEELSVDHDNSIRSSQMPQSTNIFFPERQSVQVVEDVNVNASSPVNCETSTTPTVEGVENRTRSPNNRVTDLELYNQLRSRRIAAELTQLMELSPR